MELDTDAAWDRDTDSAAACSRLPPPHVGGLPLPPIGRAKGPVSSFLHPRPASRPCHPPRPPRLFSVQLDE
eukprot:3939761-Rhodomonas_salina.2